MNQIQSRSRFYVQCLGTIVLVTALLFDPPSFDFVWFLFALLVAVGLPLLNIWGATAVEAITLRTAEPYAALPDYHPAQKYFLAMEDGVFLVPLLWTGIDSLTAAIASVFYGLFAFRHYSNSMVITRSLAYFLLILWVLPHGLWMVVVAHAVAEIAIRYLFPHCFSIHHAASQESAS